MSTEPTRAEVERLKDELGLADDPDTLLRALAAAETTRPPAESSPEPPAGPERGTGEAELDTSTLAVGVIPADLLNCNPRTVIHFTAEEMARAPLTIEIDHEPLLQFEPSYPPTTIPHEAMPYLAGFVNALKPLHLNDAATSLEAIATAERGRLHTGEGMSLETIQGIEYAADLLRSTARDEEDQA
jgi:hypothetical protein